MWIWFEGEPAYHGMQSIGTDDNVEGSGISLLEGHDDSARALLKGGDRVVEEVAHSWTSCVIKDGPEIAAEDLVGGDDAIPTERFDWHFRAMASGCIDPGNAALGHRPGADLVQQSHPFHDGATGTAKINSLAALSWSRCPLNYGDGEAGLA
jgi:hypothetical protein